MRTRISVFCDKVIEAGWLLALVVAPLFFNVYSSRVFEPDKLSLLRSIASLMAVAWLVKVSEEGLGRSGRRQGASEPKALDRFLRVPLVVPVLLFVVVYLLATVTSVVPRISFWGSYQRLQGTFTTLSYIVIFFLLLENLRRPEQLRRLLTTVILTSLPISLYGLLQHYGLDPLPWAGDVSQRVASHMGNAIFIGAYMILVIPLTLGRVIQLQTITVTKATPRLQVGLVLGFWALMLLQLWCWTSLGFERGLVAGVLIVVMLALAALYFRLPVPRLILLGCYGLTLSAQVVCLIFTQSRGPWLGMAGALAFFVLVMLVMLARSARGGRPQAAGDLLRGIGMGIGALALAGALIWLFVRQFGAPLLGVVLAAGAIGLPYIVLVALRKGLRWLWISYFVQILLVAGALIVFNLPQARLETLRNTPYLGRLGRMLETETDTGKVRVLIWQGAVEMLASNPLRALIGYGPEGMYVAYNPFYPPDLAHYEARNASPDRSHNETFDALIMTGVIGCGVYVALFGSVFYYGLLWLGLIQSQLQKRLFLICGVVGALLGLITPYILERSFRFSGVGLPLGFVGGLFVYVLLSAAGGLLEQAPAQTDAAGRDLTGQVLLAALVAAIVAHFIEINFGIAVAATRTYFWTYAALIVLLGQKWVSTRLMDAPETAEAAPIPPLKAGVATRPESRKGGHRRGASAAQHALAPQPAASGEPVTIQLLVMALVVGLILLTLAWDYTTNVTGLDDAVSILVASFSTFTAKGRPDLVSLGILWVVLSSFVLSVATVVCSVAEGETRQRDATWWLRSAGVFMLVAGGIGGLFALIHASRLDPTAMVPNMIYEYAATVALVWVALSLVLHAGTPRPEVFTQGLAFIGYAILVVACLFFIESANLRIVKADVFYKQGLRFDGERAWDSAAFLYQKAIEITPSEDFYYLFRGRALMEKAKTERDVKARDALFTSALTSLEQARRLNPLNTDHSANMGRLYRTWAELDADANGRRTKLQRALDLYQEATRLSSRNAQLYNEWGLVYLLLGDAETALAKYQQSLALDREFLQTYVLLGDLYISRREWPEAIRYYEYVVAREQGLAQAWSALGYAYSQVGDWPNAITANMKVLLYAPNDYGTLKNLAILNSEMSRPAEALIYAQRAISLAPEQERPVVESFIQQLRSQIGKGKP